MRIVRGQRVRLDPSAAALLQIEVDLATPADVAAESVCLLLDADSRALSEGVVLGIGSTSKCGGVEIRPSGFVLRLGKLPADVDRLILGLGLNHAHERGAASASALGVCHAKACPEVGETVQYDFSGRDFGRETALQLLEIYRKDGWRLAAVGAGFLGGLAAMLSQHGARLPRPSTTGSKSGSGPDSPVGRLRLPVAWPAATQPVVPQGLVDAVGLVVVETTAGEVHTGTGFSIGPGGLLLTADHTVDDAREVQVAMHGSGELRVAEVVARAPEFDSALLWLTDRLGTATWLLLGEPGSTPGLGDELGLLAFPLGLELGTAVTYSQGIVNSHRKMGARPVLQIDVGAAPGSSGGPLFRRRDGRVVGILTGGRPGADKGMHINFATDIQVLRTLGWLA